MKQIPAVHEHEVKKVKLGRPQGKQQLDAFLEVARLFEEIMNKLPFMTRFNEWRRI